MNDTPQFPGPGCIVEYLQDNQPQVAMVMEEHGGRVRLFTQRGRETAMPAARLLPWTGPRGPMPVSRAAMEEQLHKHQEIRREASQSINIMEIWDLAQGELTSAPLDWFAGLIWDSPDPDRLAAMGRALLEAKTHFKFQPPLFLIYPEHTVAARLAEQEAAREHQELVVAGQDFFAELWKTGRAVPPASAWAVEKLAALVRRRISELTDPSEDELWRNLTKKLPEHPHQALILAQAWGLVPTHYNFHLDQAGYDWQDAWSAAHAPVVDEILQDLHCRAHAEEKSGLISVDSASTRDIDDAFALTMLDNGEFSLTMAIACPCLNWPWGSALDAAVADRASSLYLPEGVSHMLPERLGLDAFSLLARHTRPALILEFQLNALGATTNFVPRLGWVQLEENTTYERVEQAVATRTAPFAQAHDLALALRQARIHHGAVVFDQPDPELALESDNDLVRVLRKAKPDTTAAQLLVSEFMVLANTEIARWAIDQRLPLLYRTQNVTLPPGSAGFYTRPEDMYRLSRLLANATLRTAPEPHASLGVAAYASVSSPLRRYVDFMNMGQVVHFLEYGRPRLTQGELESSLPLWRARLEAVGRVQRYRTRYWKLEYLRQQGREHSWPAVLVDETPHQAVFALPQEQILIRAPKRMVGEKCIPGGRYLLRLARVAPLLNEIKVLDVCEDLTEEKE